MHYEKKMGMKVKTEKLGKDADMGDYIDDFQKSDSPQFKGKSEKKRKEMAIAAFLSKNEQDGPCWDGYKQVGMKKKNGKDVPNCVPEETDLKTLGEYESEVDKLYGTKFSGAPTIRRLCFCDFALQLYFHWRESSNSSSFDGKCRSMETSIQCSPPCLLYNAVIN